MADRKSEEQNTRFSTASDVPTPATPASTSIADSPAGGAKESEDGRRSSQRKLKKWREQRVRKRAEKKMQEEAMKKRCGLLGKSRPSAPLVRNQREPFQEMFMSPSTPASKKGSFIPNPGVKYVLLLTDGRFSRTPVSTGRHVFIAHTHVLPGKKTKGATKRGATVSFYDPPGCGGPSQYVGGASQLFKELEGSPLEILQVSIAGLALAFGYGEEVASGENFKQKIWSWLGLPDDFRFEAILIQAGRRDVENVENVKNPELLLSCPAPSSFQEFFNGLLQALEKIAVNFGAEVQYLGPASNRAVYKSSQSATSWMEELEKSLQEEFSKQRSTSWDFKWTNRWCYNLLPDVPENCWRKNKGGEKASLINPLGLEQLVENLKSCVKKMLFDQLGNHPVALFLARKFWWDQDSLQPCVPHRESLVKKPVLEKGAGLLGSDLDVAQNDDGSTQPPVTNEDKGTGIDEGQQFLQELGSTRSIAAIPDAPELPSQLSVHGQASVGKTVPNEEDALGSTAVPNAEQETLEEEAMRLLARVKKEWCTGDSDAFEDSAVCETALVSSRDQAPFTESDTPSLKATSGLPVLPGDVDKSVVMNPTIKVEPMEAIELPELPFSLDDHCAQASSPAGEPFRGQKRSAGVCDGKSTPMSSSCGLSPSCPVKRRRVTKH